MVAITINISSASGEPLYEQISAQLRRQILDGTLTDGERLPSIRTLARELRVSIITTKRAYEELEREGLLSLAVGRGAFVLAEGIAAARNSQMDELTALLDKAAGLAKSLGLSAAEYASLADKSYAESNNRRDDDI